MRCATPEAVKLFHEGSLTMAEMSHRGIKIDTDYLDDAIERCASRVKEIEAELKSDPVYETWKAKFGKKSNIGSGEQLGKILFDELGYEAKEFTDTGRYKVNSDALAGVKLDFVKKWIEAEKYKDAGGTYLSGIKRETDQRGRLHPFFHLHTTRSYRGSSSGINFQNLPIRDRLIGELIRQAFIPDSPKYQLVDGDFGQLEVRVAGCYTKDRRLISYINDETKDMHRDMAMQIFKCGKELISKDMRHLAKNKFVFPEFYGSRYLQCAKVIWNTCEIDDLKMQGTDVSVLDHLKSQGIKKRGLCDFDADRPQPHSFEAHLLEVENDFWNRRFHEYTEWKQSYWKQYQERGYLRMHTGFVCSGLMTRKQVTNYPIQGSAFHCLLWCVVEIAKELKRRKMRSRLLGQIHDSVVACVHRRERDDYISIVIDVMTRRLVDHWRWIIVPLAIEIEAAPPGASWFQKEKVEI